MTAPSTWAHWNVLNFLVQFSPQPLNFMNCCKDMLDPDFSLTAWIVSNCPHRGQRLHPRPLCTNGVEGCVGPCPEERVCGSQLCTKEGGGAPGYEEGGSWLECCLADCLGRTPIELMDYMYGAHPEFWGAPKSGLVIFFLLLESTQLKFDRFFPLAVTQKKCKFFLPFLVVRAKLKSCRSSALIANN